MGVCMLTYRSHFSFEAMEDPILKSKQFNLLKACLTLGILLSFACNNFRKSKKNAFREYLLS